MASKQELESLRREVDHLRRKLGMPTRDEVRTSEQFVNSIRGDDPQASRRLANTLLAEQDSGIGGAAGSIFGRDVDRAGATTPTEDDYVSAILKVIRSDAGRATKLGMIGEIIDAMETSVTNATEARAALDAIMDKPGVSESRPAFVESITG